MALTRADTLTSTLKKQEYFSDFLDSFAVTPINNDLGKVTNENAVKQSLKNLILTNLGERLFQPTLGSNVRKSLFEFNDVISARNIEFNIENTIKFNEKRVSLLSVKATPKSGMDNNFQIDLIFSLINNPEPISMSFLLKRVR